MSAIEIHEGSALVIKYDTGKDPITQKVVVKTKSYGSVKENANTDDLFVVAKSISGLQEHILQDVLKKNTYSINE